MKYFKSCLPKRNLQDTTILLISIAFIEIWLLYWWNSYSSIPISSNFIIFYSFLYMVLTFFIYFLIYNFVLFYLFLFKSVFWSKFVTSKLSFLETSKELFKIIVFIIVIKLFLSSDNIFFYTQQAFVFHLLRDFCKVHDHIATFFFFLL